LSSSFPAQLLQRNTHLSRCGRQSSRRYTPGLHSSFCLRSVRLPECIHFLAPSTGLTFCYVRCRRLSPSLPSRIRGSLSAAWRPRNIRGTGCPVYSLLLRSHDLRSSWSVLARVFRALPSSGRHAASLCLSYPPPGGLLSCPARWLSVRDVRMHIPSRYSFPRALSSLNCCSLVHIRWDVSHASTLLVVRVVIRGGDPLASELDMEEYAAGDGECRRVTLKRFRA